MRNHALVVTERRRSLRTASAAGLVAVRGVARHRRIRASFGAAVLVLSLVSFGATGAIAAPPPVKIVSVTPDPATQHMTVEWITYDRATRTTTISVTPNCYWYTIYPSYPGGEPVTYLTGVVGADVVASQRDETTYAFVVGGECEEPATLIVQGLKPGPATLEVGVVLSAQHVGFYRVTYQVILR
jgi:hypothetical protein